MVTAACCDSLLILLAAAGVSAAVGAVEWLRQLLLGGGILFLLWAGWMTWRAAPLVGEATAEPVSTRRQVAFTMACSLGNPHAIVDTIGVIGTSALAYQGARLVAFTAACMAVSWGWFLFLAMAGRLLSRMDLARRLLNPVSAAVMWVSAAYLAVSLFS